MQKRPEKTKKRQKRMQHMCAAMLRWMQDKMNFKPRDMRAVLVAPGAKPMSRTTYDGYLSGRRDIPADMAAKVRDLYRGDREFMTGICGGVRPVAGISPGEILRRKRQVEVDANFTSSQVGKEEE